MKQMIAGAACLAATTAPIFAQQVDELKTTEWNTYDAWGNKHKVVYQEIRQHPEYAYSDEYIARHPELRVYYDEHPVYYTYVRHHHDWYRHHPHWVERTTTTTTTDEP